MQDTKPDAAVATRPAIVYVRFSPKPADKITAETLENQLDICERYCATHGLHVAVRLQDPLVSARSTKLRDRPEGAKIADLLDGGIRDIVAVRLDRVFRDTVDGLESLNAWNAQGVALHLADQGGCSVNCNTATGTMIATMLLAYASFEPALTAERTKSSMLHRQKNGQRMTSKETLPWGWMEDPADPSKMVPCTEELGLSTVVDGYAAMPGVSLSGIARRLNGDGVLCRGRRWDHAKVKRALEAQWDVSSTKEKT